MTCLSYAFIDHAVKHKKTTKNRCQSLFEISQTKNKNKSKLKKIDHGRVTETYLAELLKYFSCFYHEKFIYLNTSTNEVT